MIALTVEHDGPPNLFPLPLFIIPRGPRTRHRTMPQPLEIAVDPDVYLRPNYSDDWHSETTSIGSSIYHGLMENGRRYQTLSDREYLVPSDDLAFESYEAGHLLALVLDSERENPLFRAPIEKDPKHILDIGTGKGNWAIDVADMFPSTTVRGVDLFPPPITWMPPNCILEVDNILEEWTWRDPLDLIHMRIMTGSFDHAGWDHVYTSSYRNLRPGGWIEQLEGSTCIDCIDDSLPADSILRTWGPTMNACGERAGLAMDVLDAMSDRMEKAGFVDLQEKSYKWPIGPWAREQKYKEAGVVNFQHWLSGMEGWCMWLLTHFGAPHPWSKDEVTVFLAKVRSELKNPKYHIYQRARRVWARKPFPGELTPETTPIKSEEE
ncbi:hypothetical protein DTO006G1_757 [Penicillium roqueforti]|nr:hypothetical protein CBS147337_828 [Penicillium roqueforti]KAI2731916.1 hypothetical protein CBS147332_1055 [Penicillium roqueforti]KAI2764339.1 hypothetical protein DTO006G1_757 [Penicillium roqueforti]KAI3122616.1 hypothetical protein CBS147331_1066 [Penicillium roqueforti]KAI3172235.1 hypothetical protein CBS147317_1664 [Penicillium roqueforti]